MVSIRNGRCWFLALVLVACGGDVTGENDQIADGFSMAVYDAGQATPDTAEEDSYSLADTASPQEDLSEVLEDLVPDSESDATVSLDQVEPIDQGSVAIENPGEMGPNTFTFKKVYDIFHVHLDVYVPDGEGPFEVVIFTHGFQLSPERYTQYGEHLASWGYLAVLPKLPGGLFNGPTHVELRDHLKTVLDWVDLSLEDPEHHFFEKLIPGKIGLAGHSMGGKISLLTATEDERVRAVYAVDPVDAVGGPGAQPSPENPSVTPELMGQISVPLVLLGETTNGSSSGLFGQACAPEENNFHQYYLHAEVEALEIEMIGANHMSFIETDGCGFTCSVCPKGTDDTAVTQQRTAQYMIAFFNRTLRGQSGYDLYLTGEAMLEDVEAGLVKIESKNGF